MFLLAAYHLGCAEVIYVLRAEDRFLVFRAKGTKPLQVVMQLAGDVLEVYHHVNVE